MVSGRLPAKPRPAPRSSFARICDRLGNPPFIYEGAASVIYESAASVIYESAASVKDEKQSSSVPPGADIFDFRYTASGPDGG